MEKIDILNGLSLLKEREKEVFYHWNQYLNREEVGKKTRLSRKTVTNYLNGICVKFGVSNWKAERLRDDIAGYYLELFQELSDIKDSDAIIERERDKLMAEEEPEPEEGEVEEPTEEESKEEAEDEVVEKDDTPEEEAEAEPEEKEEEAPQPEAEADAEDAEVEEEQEEVEKSRILTQVEEDEIEKSLEQKLSFLDDKFEEDEEEKTEEVEEEIEEEESEEEPEEIVKEKPERIFVRPEERRRGQEQREKDSVPPPPPPPPPRGFPRWASWLIGILIIIVAGLWLFNRCQPNPPPIDEPTSEPSRTSRPTDTDIWVPTDVPSIEPFTIELPSAEPIPLPFEDDFSTGYRDEWLIYGEEPYISEGMLTTKGETTLILPDETWEDYRIEFATYSTSPGFGFPRNELYIRMNGNNGLTFRFDISHQQWFLVQDGDWTTMTGDKVLISNNTDGFDGSPYGFIGKGPHYWYVDVSDELIKLRGEPVEGLSEGSELGFEFTIPKSVIDFVPKGGVGIKFSGNTQLVYFNVYP